jgi:hypothetical protein
LRFLKVSNSLNFHHSSFLYTCFLPLTFLYQNILFPNYSLFCNHMMCILSHF